MIPAQNDTPLTIQQEEAMSSKTYFLDLANQMIYGKCDGVTAIKQAASKMLQTERYEDLIYSPNYGTELAELFGQPVSFVCPELERRIAEALTQDKRMRSVDEFSFEKKKGAVSCTFSVHTNEGDFELTQEVRI